MLPKSLPSKLLKEEDDDNDLDMEDETLNASELEEVTDVEFVASTSAKDIKDIEEKTAQNEENILSTIKLYKKNHIRHLFRFGDEPSKPVGKGTEQYPRTCDKRCLYCREFFTTIPIFPPIKLEKPTNVFVLSRDVFCSKIHAKIPLSLGTELDGLIKLDYWHIFVECF
jgi:hypothetical protein